jgi:predicted transcriptional regulator
MSTAKHDVELLLSKLPDNCSLEEIQYHLYVLEKVRRGLEQAATGDTVSQDEVERRLR